MSVTEEKFPENLKNALDAYVKALAQGKEALEWVKHISTQIQLIIDSMKEERPSLSPFMPPEYVPVLRQARHQATSLGYEKLIPSRSMLDAHLLALFCAGLLVGPLGGERGLEPFLQQVLAYAAKPEES